MHFLARRFPSKWKILSKRTFALWSSKALRTGQSLLGIGQNLRRLADSSPTLSAAGEPAQTTIGMGIAKMK